MPCTCHDVENLGYPHMMGKIEDVIGALRMLEGFGFEVHSGWLSNPPSLDVIIRCPSGKVLEMTVNDFFDGCIHHDRWVSEKREMERAVARFISERIGSHS